MSKPGWAGGGSYRTGAPMKSDRVVDGGTVQVVERTGDGRRRVVEERPLPPGRDQAPPKGGSK